MEKKIITLITTILIITGCSKERKINHYPHIIPPIIKDDYPEINKLFKNNSKTHKLTE